MLFEVSGSSLQCARHDSWKIISGWLWRYIWFTELPSYPGLYLNDSKLCFCRHPISISLLHLRWHWQPYTQGGRREGARVRQDEGHHRGNGRSSLVELKTRHWPGARGREGLEKNAVLKSWSGEVWFLGGNSLLCKISQKGKTILQENSSQGSTCNHWCVLPQRS